MLEILCGVLLELRIGMVLIRGVIWFILLPRMEKWSGWSLCRRRNIMLLTSKSAIGSWKLKLKTSTGRKILLSLHVEADPIFLLVRVAAAYVVDFLIRQPFSQNVESENIESQR
jgi:hypothetical protein